MSASIIELASKDRIDAAWNAYVEFAERAVDNPRLLIDREFFGEMARRQERYKRLFLALDRQA